MPKYIFECESCKTSTHKYVPVNTETVKCACGKDMKRQLPIIKGQTEVREIIDPYTNKRHLKDQEDIMKQRKSDHFKNIEIPRLIEKYSVETCLENGWLIYNDKGELTINKNWVPLNK